LVWAADDGGGLPVAAFTRDGKAVFQVEYRIPPSRFCGQANRLGFSSIKKARLLARREAVEAVPLIVT
jgi:hypothetical protein